MSDQPALGEHVPPAVEEARLPDAVVVGTGMGGAAAGWALANAGLDVLFLEKGREHFVAEDRGSATEPGQRLAGAQWPETIVADIDDVTSEVHAPLGCGVGGSTIIYAAALERFQRSDIESSAALPLPGGSWPISWDELVSYYDQAERLLGLKRGTERPPHPADERLFEALRRNGHAPRRLHVGNQSAPGCNGCGGRKCFRSCKSDAQRIFVEPALRRGASLFAETEVLRIELEADGLLRVVYIRDGKIAAVRARTVLLGAGAYRTPALLLASRSQEWPQGIGNTHDAVGRNLMFHANEWLAVWPRGAAGRTSGLKTLALDELWTVGGERLGGVQATGMSADYGNILARLTARFDRGPLRRLRWLRPACKLVAHAAARLFGRAAILVMIVQDYPHWENRIVWDETRPGRIRFQYRIPDELRRRATLARSSLRHAFRGTRTMTLNSDVDLNLGHPCGTCRMGDDPQTSVVDRECRVHGIEGLYVVDASFMPGSGGTNPSLTIAANALRVGVIVAQRLQALPHRTGMAEATT